MALIRTIADARLYIRLSNLADTSSLPDVEATELLHIVPVIGQALYDKLNTDYDTNNVAGATTDAYKLAHRYIQRTVASLSYAAELGTYQALITDSGVRTMESNNMQAAHSWEFKALKENLLLKSAQGMELLLRHLFTRSADLPEWTASNEYNQYNQLAIRNATDFDRYFKLYDPYRTYHLLRSIITDVQERYIIPIIGREMLNWIKGRPDAIITVDNVAIDMMYSFKKAIVCFTVKHAMVQQSVRFSDAGFTILSSGSNEEEQVSGRTDASLSKFGLMRNELEREGQNWLKDLAKYMRGAYAGDFTNDFDETFDTAFELGPLAPDNATVPVMDSKNGARKIFSMLG